jgi:hypothetical protein
MRVNHDGNVGIGSATPSHKFQVSGTSYFNGATKFAVSTWHVSDDNKNRFYYGTNGRTYFGSGDGSYEFRNSSDTGVVFIDTSGRVGIGIAPAYALDVIGSARVRGYTIGVDASNNIKYVFTNDGGSSYVNSGSFGIGTSSPSAKLSVSDPTESKINFLIGSVERAFINYNEASSIMRVDSDAAIILATNNTERIRIDSFGNVCIGTTSSAYKLEVAGSFAAQTKSFVIDHQSKPNHKLRHGSLEGPENGVYVRGRTNTNVIELPEYWTWLIDDESITVTLTPIGTHQTLYVEKIEDNKVYIGGNANINCFYMINAERKDVDKLIVEY